MLLTGNLTYFRHVFEWKYVAITGNLTDCFMAVEEPFSHFDPFVDDSPQMAKLPEGKISTFFRIIPRIK